MNTPVILRRTNIVVLTLMILFSLTPFIGLNTYGLGLGDVFIATPVLILALTYFILTKRLLKKQNDSYWIIFLLIFIPLLLFLLYKMSYGRGVEYKWDGNFFFIKGR